MQVTSEWQPRSHGNGQHCGNSGVVQKQAQFVWFGIRDMEKWLIEVTEVLGTKIVTDIGCLNEHKFMSSRHAAPVRFKANHQPIASSQKECSGRSIDL